MKAKKRTDEEIDKYFEELFTKGHMSRRFTAEELKERGLIKSNPEVEKTYSEADEDEVSDEEWEKGLWKTKKKLGGHW